MSSAMQANRPITAAKRMVIMGLSPLNALSSTAALVPTSLLWVIL